MNIFNWLIKTYYKIPTVHWRNPIRFEKRDDRNLQWFKQRRKYGFDERTMWNLGGILHHAICEFLNIKDKDENYTVSLEEFKKWLIQDTYGVQWIYNRITIYIKWDCPTFYMDKNYQNFPPDIQKKMLHRMAKTIEDRLAKKTISEEDVKFLHKHIFHLGW
jgi:hypothetical protein